MANADIGTIQCTLCNKEAAVRKNRNGGLYWSCTNCGHITPRLLAGQEYILENAKMYGPEGKPAPVVEPVEEGAPLPAPEVEKKPDIPRAKGGRFAFETIL